MMLRGVPLPSRVIPEILVLALVTVEFGTVEYVVPFLSVIVPESRNVTLLTAPITAHGVDPAGTDVFQICEEPTNLITWFKVDPPDVKIGAGKMQPMHWLLAKSRHH